MSCQDISYMQERRGGRIPEIGFCAEKNRLAREFLKAIRELVDVQNRQIRAVIAGDPELAPFGVLLREAQEKKERAKYAWIAHVEAHNCEEG